MKPGVPETIGSGQIASRDRSSDLSGPPAYRRLVIQMHGEPGSGKSTVARALARELRAVHIDKDVIKAALLRTGIAEREAATGAYEAYFAQARSIVDQGHAIVLDSPVYWESVEQKWLALSALAGSPPILIECICPDRDELIRRLATRDALESQPRQPLDLTRHPGAGETTFRPRLTLDTTRPLADLVEEALTFLAQRMLGETPTTNYQRLAPTTP